MFTLSCCLCPLEDWNKTLLVPVKWHSATWPYTMTIHYWSDFIPSRNLITKLDLLPNLRGFHRTFATGMACRQGTLTPLDTWSRPFGTCICSTCWDQSFFRTCRCFSRLCSSNIPRYFLDFACLDMLFYVTVDNISYMWRYIGVQSALEKFDLPVMKQTFRHYTFAFSIMF